MIQRTIPATWSSNERAIPKLQEKLKASPENADWNTALGEAYLQKARETGDPSYYTKAEGLFDRALASDHRPVQALIGQSALAMSRHDFTRARSMAEEAIAENPNIASAYGVLTDALVELGEYDAAIRTLDAMIRMKPNLSSYSRISYLRELTGDSEGAIQAMQMAVDSGAPEAENTAWCLVQLGNLFLNSGRLAEADRQYRLALFRFPNYVHAFAGLGRLAVAQKDLDSAVHYYQRAIDGVPLPEFVIALGDVYETMGKAKEAKAEFDLVGAMQQIYRANGVSMDVEMALFDADRGVHLDRAVAVAQEEWSKRKSVRVADVYAWALFRSGKYREARQMMEQALRLGTRDPLFLRHAEAIDKTKEPRT